MKIRICRLTLFISLILFNLYCGNAGNVTPDFAERTAASDIETQTSIFRDIIQRSDNKELSHHDVQLFLSTYLNKVAAGESIYDNLPKDPIHGQHKMSNLYPILAALRRLDTKSTGSLLILKRLCSNSRINRAVRDRCVWTLKECGAEEHLKAIGDELYQRDNHADKGVALIAYASLQHPDLAAQDAIVNEFKSKEGRSVPNVRAFLPRTKLSKENLELMIKLVKVRPDINHDLLKRISSANPDVVAQVKQELESIGLDTSNTRTLDNLNALKQ